MGRMITRREFVRTGAGVAGAVLLSGVLGLAAKKIPTAVDQVKLGKTGLKLSRLGIGTGSIGGSIQRALGTDGFNKLIRYAYDQGITYIDTANSYRTHSFVKDAIKGLPREKLFIQTKMNGNPKDPKAEIEKYLKEMGIEYIDSLLIHCMTKKGWDEDRKRIMDVMEEAKEKKIIRAHGVSCHSLPALALSARLDWVDVNLVRINPQGHVIDTPVEHWDAKSDVSHVPAAVKEIELMRKNKHGIIGMKLIGNGDFTKREQREKSIRYTMQSGLVDAAVIGFKSTAEIDEAIKTINQAFIDIA